MRFTVEVQYSGHNTYSVEAVDIDEAKEKARQKYMDGEYGIMTSEIQEEIVDMKVSIL
jgi:hypothetical protein